MAEPRTVYQLASYFEVPSANLMALAGLTRPRRVGFAEQAMKFAARSACVDDLNDEERAIFEGLVKVLTEGSHR